MTISKTIGTASAVIGLVLTISGVIYASEERYNQKYLDKEFVQFQQKTVETLDAFRKRQLLDEYRQLKLKESMEGLSPYEQAWLSQIEVELEQEF